MVDTLFAWNKWDWELMNKKTSAFPCADTRAVLTFSGRATYCWLGASNYTHSLYIYIYIYIDSQNIYIYIYIYIYI